MKLAGACLLAAIAGMASAVVALGIDVPHTRDDGELAEVIELRPDAEPMEPLEPASEPLLRIPVVLAHAELVPNRTSTSVAPAEARDGEQVNVVQVRVTDFEGKPIAGAFVYGWQPYCVQTRADGRAALAVGLAQPWLEAKAPGFEPLRILTATCVPRRLQFVLEAVD